MAKKSGFLARATVAQIIAECVGKARALNL